MIKIFICLIVIRNKSIKFILKVVIYYFFCYNLSGDNMFAQVLVEIKAKNLDKTFTYKIPNNLNVEVGERVLVPFGKQKLEGFVLKIDNEEPEYETKEIISLIDLKPVLNKELIELGK